MGFRAWVFANSNPFWPADDKIVGVTKSNPCRRQDRQRYIRKVGGPTASLVSQSGLRQPVSGAPAAYCFDIHTLRASRTVRLSAPEHHRYVRVLDWKVSRESEKGGCVEERMACKCKQGNRCRIIFKSCEQHFGPSQRGMKTDSEGVIYECRERNESDTIAGASSPIVNLVRTPACSCARHNRVSPLPRGVIRCG